MTYLLALDQGTTSTRAILFDAQRKVVKVAQQELHNTFPQPDYVLQDAEEIYQSAINVINELFEDGKISPNDVHALGISNQRETTIMWNKKTGKPVYAAIVWQSKQSLPIIERYQKARIEPFFKEHTGLLLDPYFAFSKILWIYENIPGVKDDPDIIFGTVDTWLLWNLTKGEVHATDVTNASRVGLMNIKTLKWDAELLDLFKIPSKILPEIKKTADDFGMIKDARIKVACPIHSLVGDQQAALFGQACFAKGDLKNTYGTGGFLLVNTGEEIVSSANGLLTTVAWQIKDQITYALEGSIFVSGSLIQWLRDGLRILKSAKDSEAMARSVPDTGGVVIVPALSGLGAPYWDAKAKGAIFGINRGTTKEQIVRAALEAMAFQVKDLINVITKDVDFPLKTLKVDGGASENDFLLQFQSDILQMPLWRNPLSEATALGAASLAGLKDGFYQMEAFNNQKGEAFKPLMSEKEAQSRYRLYVEALRHSLYSEWRNIDINEK